MKSKLLCCILVSALAVQLCGCGEPNVETTENSGTAEAESSGTSLESGPSEEDIFLSLADVPWKDNSLDAYSAVLNMPLQYTESEDAINGGVCVYFLRSTGASVFKKHLFPEADDCWDEIKTVSDQGEETSFRLAFWEGMLNQAWVAGGIAGNGHYIMMTLEQDDDQSLLYRFFETDEDMQILNSFYVDCLDKSDYEFPLQLQVDALGNLHMITDKYSDSTYHYYIVASDGTFLTEASPREGFPPGQIPDLFLLYDGRVGMQSGEQMKCADVETGKTEVLANIKSSYRGCTLWDEKTLLYADGTGLYRSGLSGENPELLYTWSNHGVSASEIAAMQVTESGDISLIYMDYKGANYLKLTPTTEEVEIQEITFAVSATSNQKYQAVVAAFNKKYPAYRIKMQTGSINDSSLLTALIAGKGPVLIDTFLVGFENNVEWWEPLEDVFGQADLDEELIPQVVDCGRINGTLYGVVTDFFLNTVVTFAEEPDEWDYDTFLSCFDEEDPSMKSVYNAISGSDGYSFLVTFFLHDLREKYLYDAEACTTRFDSEEFRKMLRLARYFTEDERQGSSEDLRQGTSPCAVAVIAEPEDLACLRIWGGDKIRFIGYPSGEGSRHYIAGGSPITIRANATAEEKRLARSFLQFLLSYEAQTEAVSAPLNDNYNMSVRRDVLDEQINSMDEYSFTCLLGFPQFHLEDQVDNELDGATLYGLLEKAEPKQYMPRELLNIFVGELDDYLSGNLTEDMLIEHLENRVGLFLSEQK